MFPKHWLVLGSLDEISHANSTCASMAFYVAPYLAHVSETIAAVERVAAAAAALHERMISSAVSAIRKFSTSRVWKAALAKFMRHASLNVYVRIISTRIATE